MDDKAYYVDSVGFKPLKEFVPLEEKQRVFLESLPARLQAITSNSVNPLKDNLLAVNNEALKLNVEPSIIREEGNLVSDERIDKMADSYEEMYHKKFAPVEQDKPKQLKTPKL